MINPFYTQEKTADDLKSQNRYQKGFSIGFPKLFRVNESQCLLARAVSLIARDNEGTPWKPLDNLPDVVDKAKKEKEGGIG